MCASVFVHANRKVTGDSLFQMRNKSVKKRANRNSLRLHMGYSLFHISNKTVCSSTKEAAMKLKQN